MFYLFKARSYLLAVVILQCLIVSSTGSTSILYGTTEGSEKVDNVTCHQSESEESEFPEDLFTEGQRAQGAIIFHIILAVYCFAAIATVCTEHFLPTIKCICEDLKLSDDVAAATFMSIATSSPELFTNIIGTFITESDIGVGHVLGNAYYDMFFVAALGGLVAKQGIVLDWWPITRDCFIYLIVAITLTCVVADGIVETHEAAILLSLYVLYFVIMFNNRRFIKFCKSRFGIEMNDPVEDELSVPVRPAVLPPIIRKVIDDDLEAQESLAPAESSVTESSVTDSSINKKKSKCCRVWSVIKLWAIAPLMFLTFITIPDVRKKSLRKFYPAAFVLCVAWIGVSTYLGTWMISVIGQTIGVPDSIMGMIFMAAGGSVVEAYAVYYKARRGECSIGLSNSMGCNTLDVTMCLALPWLIKTLLPVALSGCGSATSAIVLRSSALHVNCILLIISVVVLFAALYANKFKLNKILGGVCGFLYAAILIIAITVESYGVHL